MNVYLYLIVLTLIPRGPNSNAKHLVIISIADFAIEYAEKFKFYSKIV